MEFNPSFAGRWLHWLKKGGYQEDLAIEVADCLIRAHQEEKVDLGQFGTSIAELSDIKNGFLSLPSISVQ